MDSHSIKLEPMLTFASMQVFKTSDFFIRRDTIRWEVGECDVGLFGNSFEIFVMNCSAASFDAAVWVDR